MTPRRQTPGESPAPGADAIEKEAADWIARLDRGLSSAERVDFAAWEAADPRHHAELERLQATWRALDTGDEVPEIMQIAHEVEREDATRDRSWWRRAGLRTAGAVAMTAAVIAIAGVFASRSTSVRPAQIVAHYRSYQIVPSVAKRLPLIDGSVVQLKDGGAIEPAFSADRRVVRLLHGEAYFSVAHDASRPFIVLIDGVAIRAVGTAFNIRVDAKTVEVLVTEGKVRIDDDVDGQSRLTRPAPVAANADSPAEAALPTHTASVVTSQASKASEIPVLAAGHRVVIDPRVRAAIKPEAVTPSDIERTLAWQETQFVFDATPLGDAVAAFNSFNRVQLVLGDPALEKRRVGGTFRADNVDALVRLLKTGFEIEAEHRGEKEIVLRPSR